jgi:hypothetical protein
MFLGPDVTYRGLGDLSLHVVDLSRHPEEGALQSRKPWDLGRRKRGTYE